MSHVRPGKQALSCLLALVMMMSVLSVSAFAAEGTADESGAYYLMNIPYEEFYQAVGITADSTDFDAVSAATNKVGNYGKAGGSFHSAQTAQPDGEGGFTAVGGENGARCEGVTWAVKVAGGQAVMDRLQALGGREIQRDSAVTVGTLGRGATSTSSLVGYEAMNEAPAYSYYSLSEEPDHYLQVSLSGNDLVFEAADGKNDADETAPTAAAVSYGTAWGDVQVEIAGVDKAEDALVNAMVITTEDGAEVGLVHLYHIWTAADIAWKVESVAGLDGKKITNIRYYCSVKDPSVDEENDSAPAYQNFIYDYTLSDLEIMPVYTGTVTAAFNDAGEIELTGLPEDIQNPMAKVYHTTGGRNAVYTYLTPLEVDPADQDIDPANAAVEDGKIAISSSLVTVTNDKGESMTYGQPVGGTEYTVEISSDNWIINKMTAAYAAGEQAVPDSQPEGFADVAADARYRAAVEYVVEKGLMSGVSSTAFAPDAAATRAMLVAALYHLENEPSAGSSRFTDVPAGGEYANAVAWAAAQGIVTGYAETSFGPSDPITREQMAAILYRYASYKGYRVTEQADLSGFADAGSVSAYAQTAVRWASAAGLLEGRALAPADGVTRGQAAVILMNFCENAAK